jgi:hypothetical protein
MTADELRDADLTPALWIDRIEVAGGPPRAQRRVTRSDAQQDRDRHIS